MIDCERDKQKIRKYGTNVASQEARRRAVIRQKNICIVWQEDEAVYLIG
jgi:hypothetical protein